MAHNNGPPPPPPFSFNPYPAWPQMAHPAAASAQQLQQSAMPYTPVQPTSAPHAAQPTLAQNVSLPPELQNLNLTPQQLAAMFTFFQAQSSAVSIPPAPPSFTPTPASQPTFQTHSPYHSTPAAAYAPQEPANTAAKQSERSHVPLPSANVHSTQAIMSTDREDGELSDPGQETLQSRPPPGPRKRKHNTPPNQNRLVSQRSSHYNDLQTNGHGHPRPGTASDHVKAATQHEPNQIPSNVDDASKSKSMIMTFVAAMHEEGFSFNELAAEGLDPILLRATYAELQIPVLPKDSLPQASLGAAPAPTPGISESASQREHIAPTAPPQTAKSAAANVSSGAPAVPIDRKSYLARLQAAKVKKGSAPVPNSITPAPDSTALTPNSTAPAIKPISKPVPATSPITAPAAQSKPLPATETTSIPVTQVGAPTKPQATQKTSDAATELVRKKMEALKSLKRRMAPQPPTTSADPPSINPAVLAQADAVQSKKQDETHDVPVRSHQSSSIDAPIDPSQAPTSVPTVPPPGLSTGGIPGLFMATVSSKPSPSSTPSQKPVLPLQVLPANALSEKTPNTSPRPTPTTKRRPVAADLNEANVQPDVSIKYKRPFGQSRQNSSDDAMIIEVSDDEDGFGDNVQPITETTVSARQKSIRDLPPLRDFPHRAAVNKSSLVPGTPTPLGTPGTSSDVEELKRKEQEINALQLRIQEFERRKTALRAKGQMVESRTESPSASQRVTVPQGTPAGRVTLPGLSVSQLPGLEAKVEPSSDRQSKLKADISASDAALNNRRSQMMELQRQMAELQKQCEEEELNKQKLRVQLESLDIDTKGMTHLEMQAKKDEIDKQMDEAQTKERVDDMVIDSDSPHAATNDEAAVTPNSSHLDHGTSRKSSSTDGLALEARDLLSVPRGTKSIVGSATGLKVDSQATTVDENNKSGAEDLSGSAAVEPPVDDEEDDEDSDDDEGSSMSESTDSEDDEVPVQAPVNAASPEASSSDAEMDTSESSSDESGEDNNEQAASTEATRTTLPAVSPSMDSRPPAEEESDIAETPVDEELEGTDMDLDSSESDDESEYEPLAATAAVLPATVPAPVSQSTDADGISKEVADDVAPELQGSTELQRGLGTLQNTCTTTWPQHTSYESSLKVFKKYRFHPDYLQNVSGGYHSLTYSHQILPHVPLCRFEFYGGDCRDQSCEGQHWRDLALSDDQLLIQLGTNQANPGKNKEEISSYNVGLKRIIQELRQEGTSAIEAVISRIAEYRRQFIGDPTVVVTQ